MFKLSATFLILCAAALGHPAPAQNDNRAQTGGEAQCPAPVYKLAEVTVKPHIVAKPEPQYTEEARRRRVSGKVVVEAVLCASGRVTDIEVVKGLPHGLSESAVRAARAIQFEPGTKDGEAVSVRIRLVYGFDIY